MRATGSSLHLRKPSGEDRLRQAVQRRPAPPRRRRRATSPIPELAAAIDRAAGGPAPRPRRAGGPVRVVAAIVAELGASGLLRAAGADPAAPDDDPADGTAHRGRRAAAARARSSTRSCGVTITRRWSASATTTAPAVVAARPGARRARRSPTASSGRRGRSCRPRAGSTRPGFFDRIYRALPRPPGPRRGAGARVPRVVRRAGERGSLATEDDARRAHGGPCPDHRQLVDYGHRLGLRAWIAAREHDRPDGGRPLVDRLADDERRVYLPLVIRAPAEALGAVDAIWYVRGKLAFLFEVEWTAMVGEAVLRRGRDDPDRRPAGAVPGHPRRARRAAAAEARAVTWLRAEIERQNWHVLKWQHLDTLVARDGRAHRMARAGARPGPAHRAWRRAADDVRRVVANACSLGERGVDSRGSAVVPPCGTPTVVPVSSRAPGAGFATRAAHRATHHGHHLVDVRLPLPALDGVRQAAVDVVLEEQQCDLVGGRGERLDLLEDVEAVRLLLDEALDAPRLALDAAQARDEVPLVLRVGCGGSVRRAASVVILRGQYAAALARRSIEPPAADQR